MEKNVMSVQETADYLGFSAAKVYKLIEAKEISYNNYLKSHAPRFSLAL